MSEALHQEGITGQCTNDESGRQFDSADSLSADQTNPSPTEQLAGISSEVRHLAASFDDPVIFGEWLYECKLDEWQCHTLRKLCDLSNDAPRRIARAVCNGGGKTRLFAVAGCWILLKRRNARVVHTAGAFRQCMVLKDELSLVIHKLSGWQLKEQELLHCDGISKMLWYSADHPGLFEGQHSENMALFIDEAKSVKNEIGINSERLQAKYTLVMSSTGGASGWFYDCFASKKRFWDVDKIKASTISRLKKDWINQMREMWADHPELLSSMLDSEFTSSDPDSFIQVKDVNRVIETPPQWMRGLKRAGIDLASSLKGDMCVIVIMDGNKVVEIIAWRDDDEVRIAAKCITELRQRSVLQENVNADAGGVGSAIVKIMQYQGYCVNEIAFGGVPLVRNDRIVNRMTELWDNMASDIKMMRLILPKNDDMIDQLTKRKAQVLASGKLKLESKTEMKARGLSSPDIADAIALALVMPAFQRKSPIQKSGEDFGIPGNGDDGSFRSIDGRFSLGRF